LGYNGSVLSKHAIWTIPEETPDPAEVGTFSAGMVLAGIKMLSS
jgi:hypothetical protein